MNREAFEGYMESNPHFVGFFKPMCERDPDGTYRYVAIEEHWLTWQHATRFAVGVQSETNSEAT